MEGTRLVIEHGRDPVANTICPTVNPVEKMGFSRGGQATRFSRYDMDGDLVQSPLLTRMNGSVRSHGLLHKNGQYTEYIIYFLFIYRLNVLA
jgi:hypothetical protein